MFKGEMYRVGLSVSVVLCSLSGGTGLVAAQPPITAEANSTNTIVAPNGDRFDIGGGVLSGDGTNLFHSFTEFGLSENQIANFLANPTLLNILGRITGGNPSIIDGLIQVSGGDPNLLLLNPAGFVFGQNAQLNVPGDFTATTATGIGFPEGVFSAFGGNDYSLLGGLPDQLIFGANQTGAIINAGDLRIGPGQQVSLVGDRVVNTGTAASQGGEVNVVAVQGTNRVRISQPGNVLSLEVIPPSDRSGNPLPLTPLDLPALLTGPAANVETGLVINGSGQVELTQTGTVIPDLAGTTVISGQVDVSDVDPGAIGGTIKVLGDRIGLVTAELDASGDSGGGEIFVGGRFQGSGPEPNAQSTYVSSDSILKASAIHEGSGGMVVVWADQFTRFDGQILARGGANSGDGGFAEVSGKQQLVYRGLADLSATHGLNGTLLLDPVNITITDGDPTLEDGALPDIFLTDFPGADITITSEALANQLATVNIVLEATNDIFVDSSVLSLDLPTTAGNSVTFRADADGNGFGGFDSFLTPIQTQGGDVNISGAFVDVDVIDSQGGDIIVTAISPFAESATIFAGDLFSGGGQVNLSAIGAGEFAGEIFVDGIFSAGGAIQATAQGQPGAAFSGEINLFTIDSVSGDGVNGGDINLFATNQLTINDSLDAGNGNVTLTSNEIDFGIPPNPDFPEGEIASINGTGQLLIQPATPNRDISVGGLEAPPLPPEEPEGPSPPPGEGPSPPPGEGPMVPGNDILNLSSQDIEAIESDFAFVTIGAENGSGMIGLDGDVIFDIPALARSPVGNGSINTSGFDLIGIGNASLELIASQNIATGDISTQNQAITLTSFQGNVNTTAGTLMTNGMGPVTINAQGNINTADINTGSMTNPGGVIALTSNTGGVFTGNLNSSGTHGGAITIKAPITIETGQINSSGTVGDGGNVNLDPLEDIQVAFINAQGGNNGQGGTVLIETGRFFRALQSFLDRNQINASISTAGGQGGGAITIQYDGAPPFTVGRLTNNGTVAAITSGVAEIDFDTFFFEEIRGNITIGGAPEPPIVVPPDPPIVIPPDLPFETPEIEEALTTATLYGGGPTIQLPAPQSLSSLLRIRSLTETRELLQAIEKAAEIKPAVIYVSFAPKRLRTTAIAGSQNGASAVAIDADFSRQEAARTSEYEQFLDLPDDTAQPTLSVPPAPDDELELLLITPDGDPMRIPVPGVTRERVTAEADNLYGRISQLRAGYLAPAQQLYQWLIDPIKAAIAEAEIDNLLFVMPEKLRLIPLAALHDSSSDQFLVQQYSVGLAPSISLVNARYQNIQNAGVLALGAAEFQADQNQSKLPAVSLEVPIIAGDIRQGAFFLDQNFTLKQLKASRATNPFPIIHLATHGDFQPGAASNSYIQLYDEKLRLNQLRELGLEDPIVELLVISACRSAYGNVEAELGFGGLAVQAGVKTAVASLWYVGDTGTLALMTEFYNQLKETTTKAEALQKAQVALLEKRIVLEENEIRGTRSNIPLPEAASASGDLSHPFYWSAFTMIGSPW